MPLLSPATPVINYGTPVSASPLNRGLTIWLPVLPQRGHGNTLFDVAGRTHATLNSSPGWSGIKRPGGFGSLNCTGGSNFSVSMPAVSSTQAFTFSFWHRPTTWTGGFTALIDDTSRQWSMFFDTSGNASFLGDMTTGLVGGAMTVGNWWHVLLTRPAGSGQVVSFYVNAVLKDTGTVDRDAIAATLHFGSNPSGGGTNYDGHYDDVQFYFDRGMSDADVAALYNESRLGYPTTLNRIRLPVLGGAGGAPAGNRRRRFLCGAAA